MGCERVILSDEAYINDMLKPGYEEAFEIWEHSGHDFTSAYCFVNQLVHEANKKDYLRLLYLSVLQNALYLLDMGIVPEISPLEQVNY